MRLSPLQALLDVTATERALRACARQLARIPGQRAAVALLCAAMLSGGVGCQGRYERGQEALAEQRFDDAKRDARMGRHESPEDPRYDLLMAETLTREADSIATKQSASQASDAPPLQLQEVQKRYKEALPYAQRAFESGKLDARAGRVLGKIYWELGSPIDAVDAWRKARAADEEVVRDADYLTALRTALNMVEVFGDHARALALRQELQAFTASHEALMSGLSPETAQDLREELSPESFRKNREAVAQQYMQTRQTKEALDLYEELARDFPEESSYHYERGTLFLSMGKEEEATRAFERYVAHPNGRERRVRLKEIAIHAENLGVRSVALVFYEKLLQELPDEPSNERAPVLLKLAAITLSIAEDEEAKRYLRRYLDEMKALQGEPLRAAIYMNVASIAKQNGRNELTVQLLEEALTEAPPNLRVAEMLAENYAQRTQLGEVERVMKAYVERVVKETPGDQEVALKQAADWAERRRNFELAQHFYDRLLERAPEKSAYLLQAAKVYAAQNKQDEMRLLLERYVRQVGSDTRALLEVAQLYHSQRLFAEAEELYKKIIKIQPDNLYFAHQLARLYEDWGKIELIPKSYEPYLKANDRRPAELVAVAQTLRRRHIEQSIPYLEEAAEKGESNAWLILAELYAYQRRDADMKRALDEYLKREPNRSQALIQALSRYRNANMLEESVRILEELISLYPNNNDYHQQLSELYLAQGRERDAFELWTRYLSNARDIYTELAQMSRSFGNRKRYDWLLSFYQQLLDQGSVDAQIYELIGDTLTQAAQDQGAMLSEAARAEYTERAEAYYTLYFDKVSLPVSEVFKFANAMLQKQHFELAERAFARHIELLEKSNRAIPSQTYLSYGEVLLALKKYERAEQMFATYSELSSDSASSAKNIQEKLIKYNRQRAAEPYLLRLLSSSHGGDRSQAFQRLANIYQANDRRDDFLRLIDDYLADADNKSVARQDIQTIAITTGDWELVIRQLEQRVQANDTELYFDIGEMYWKLGNAPEAQRAWNTWIDNEPAQKIERLNRLAEFYIDHGELQLAKETLERASSQASGSARWLPLSRLAPLTLRQGEVERGMTLFEQAIESVPNDQSKNPLLELRVRTLMEIQRHELARQAALDALKYPGVDKSFFLLVLAQPDLRSGDSVRAERAIAELLSASIPIDKLVDTLLSHGYFEHALVLLEEEMVSGDYIEASDLVISRAPILLRATTMDRLIRLLQPVLDRHRDTAELEFELGDLLISQGFLEQGATFLHTALAQSASPMARAELTLLLGQTHLMLGQSEEAHRLFVEHLSIRPSSVLPITRKYLINNKKQELISLLELLSQDERFASNALPLLISVLLSEQRPLDAIATLRALIQLPNTEANGVAPRRIIESAQRVDAQRIFLDGVSVLGAHGYTLEALDLLEQAPAPVKEIEAYESLLLQLRLITRDSTSSDFATLLPEFLRASTPANPEAPSSEEAAPQDHHQERVELAQLLLLQNHPQQTLDVARPTLLADIPDASAQAFDLSLRAAMLLPQRTDALSRQLTEDYIAQRYDRVKAREEAISALLNRTQDELALELAQQNVDLQPTERHLAQLLHIALLRGDQQTYERTLDHYFRIASKPATSSTLFNHLAYASLSQPTPMLEGLLARLQSQSPYNIELKMLEALITFQRGDTQAARTLLLDYLEKVDYSTEAIDAILYKLSRHHLSGEVARGIGAHLPEDRLSLSSHLYIGLALIDIGQVKEGEEHLALTLRASPAPGHAAAQVAAQLFEMGHIELATSYAELAVKKSPDNPMASYWRGITHLVHDRVDLARQDIDRALEAGIDHDGALALAGKLAAERGHEELAADYLDRYVTIPQGMRSHYFNPSLARLSGTLGLWRDAKRPEQGIRFIEQRYPALLENLPLSESLAVSLTNLYEEAGSPQQAFQIYRELIQNAAFFPEYMLPENDRTKMNENRRFSAMTGYLNNLAYTHSTSNTEISRAHALILHSMALAAQREASYIDTLGWVLYREDDLAHAEREILRALRSVGAASLDPTASLSSPGFSYTSLHELYDHLATIREARGKSDEAAWMKVFIEAYTPSSLSSPPDLPR